MASNDYIQYLTERFVRYLDTPRDERKQRRKERRREPWDRQWFGDIPFSVQMFWQRRKSRRKHNARR